MEPNDATQQLVHWQRRERLWLLDDILRGRHPTLRNGMERYVRFVMSSRLMAHWLQANDERRDRIEMIVTRRMRAATILASDNLGLVLLGDNPDALVYQGVMGVRRNDAQGSIRLQSQLVEESSISPVSVAIFQARVVALLSQERREAPGADAVDRRLHFATPSEYPSRLIDEVSEGDVNAAIASVWLSLAHEALTGEFNALDGTSTLFSLLDYATRLNIPRLGTPLDAADFIDHLENHLVLGELARMLAGWQWGSHTPVQPLYLVRPEEASSQGWHGEQDALVFYPLLTSQDWRPTSQHWTLAISNGRQPAQLFHFDSLGGSGMPRHRHLAQSHCRPEQGVYQVHIPPELCQRRSECGLYVLAFAHLYLVLLRDKAYLNEHSLRELLPHSFRHVHRELCTLWCREAHDQQAHLLDLTTRYLGSLHIPKHLQ